MLLAAIPASDGLGFLFSSEAPRKRSAKGFCRGGRHKPFAAVFSCEEFTCNAELSDVAVATPSQFRGLDGGHDVIDVELASDRCHAAPPPAVAFASAYYFTPTDVSTERAGLYIRPALAKRPVQSPLHHRPAQETEGRTRSLLTDAHGGEGV